MDISSATARVAPDLLKALAILSDTTARRPKTILEIRKRTTFVWVIKNPIIYKLLKDFTNYRKKTTWAVVFSSRPFSNILKYKNYR